MKKIAVGALLYTILYGCAGKLNYSELEVLIRSGNCPDAVEYMQKNKSAYGVNSKLLYLVDSAIVNMQCGNYDAAQKNLHAAEDLADKLWTKSISKNAVSLLTNDLILPYAGEDFERVFINLISAICYLQTGQYDDALVECRRMDSLLMMYNAEYENKNVYKEDAFARYLSGILNEADNEPDEAFIDYYKACEAYKFYNEAYYTRTPHILEEDLLRTAMAVGRLGEALAIVSDTAKHQPVESEHSRRSGKVIFIQFHGRAPLKVEERFFIYSAHGPITIAFPRYAVSPPVCRNIRLVLSSGSFTKQADAVLVEDINAIAVKNLDDRKGRITAKTLFRAALKQVAINELSQMDHGEFIELILNILNTFVEQADTRSWHTLPGEIYMARVFVPAGDYNIDVKNCGIIRHQMKSLNIEAGETKYVFFNSRY